MVEVIKGPTDLRLAPVAGREIPSQQNTSVFFRCSARRSNPLPRRPHIRPAASGSSRLLWNERLFTSEDGKSLHERFTIYPNLVFIDAGYSAYESLPPLRGQKLGRLWDCESMPILAPVMLKIIGREFSAADAPKEETQGAIED